MAVQDELIPIFWLEIPPLFSYSSQFLHCVRCCMRPCRYSIPSTQASAIAPEKQPPDTMWLPGTWCTLGRMELGKMPAGLLEESLRLLDRTCKVLGIWDKKGRPVGSGWAWPLGSMVGSVVSTGHGQGRSRLSSSESLLEGDFLVLIYGQPEYVCQHSNKTYTGVFLCFPKNRI